jgi:hypothetical protein
MKKPLSDYLVPHEGNDGQPHIVRSASLLTLFFIIILVFAASVFETSRIRGDGHFIAAVLPSVLVVLTNDDRTEYGLGRLEHSPVLERAAQLKANDMVNKGYFDHVSPDGVTPWVWFDQVGYAYVHAGENLAINFSESADVVDAWMNSEGHKMNILDSKFTETGIATAVGTYKGKESVFVVQLFGTPRAGTSTTAFIQAEDAELEVLSSSVGEEDALTSQIGVVAGSEASAQGGEENTEGPTNATDSYQAEILEEQEVVAVVIETNPEDIPDSEPAPTGALEKPELAIQNEPQKSTGFIRWFSLHPTLILQTVYVVIGASIVIALGLMVRREVHLRHPRSVTAGILLIILMIILTYVTREYTLPMQFFASF